MMFFKKYFMHFFNTVLTCSSRVYWQIQSYSCSFPFKLPTLTWIQGQNNGTEFGKNFHIFAETYNLKNKDLIEMHLFHESLSALLSLDIWWYLKTFYDIYRFLMISSVYFLSPSESSPSSAWESSLSWYLVFIFCLLPNHLLHLC